MDGVFVLVCVCVCWSLLDSNNKFCCSVSTAGKLQPLPFLIHDASCCAVVFLSSVYPIGLGTNYKWHFYVCAV